MSTSRSPLHSNELEEISYEVAEHFVAINTHERRPVYDMHHKRTGRFERFKTMESVAVDNEFVLWLYRKLRAHPLVQRAIARGEVT